MRICKSGQAKSLAELISAAREAGTFALHVPALTAVAPADGQLLQAGSQAKAEPLGELMINLGTHTEPDAASEADTTDSVFVFHPSDGGWQPEPTYQAEF